MSVDRTRPLHVVSTVRHPETLVVADHIVRWGPLAHLTHPAGTVALWGAANLHATSPQPCTEVYDPG